MGKIEERSRGEEGKGMRWIHVNLCGFDSILNSAAFRPDYRCEVKKKKKNGGYILSVMVVVVLVMVLVLVIGRKGLNLCCKGILFYLERVGEEAY